MWGRRMVDGVVCAAVGVVCVGGGGGSGGLDRVYAGAAAGRGLPCHRMIPRTGVILYTSTVR